MRTATRRSLRRAWRMMTWPLSGHLAVTLGTGLACAISARYHDVMAPLYAAILGTFVVYPMVLVIWWQLNRSRGNGR